MMKNAFFLIVLDSIGIGSLPDWQDFDDTESNTLGHIAQAVGGLSLPHMESLGAWQYHSHSRGISCFRSPGFLGAGGCFPLVARIPLRDIGK